MWYKHVITNYVANMFQLVPKNLTDRKDGFDSQWIPGFHCTQGPSTAYIADKGPPYVMLWVKTQIKRRELQHQGILIE